MKVAVVGSRTFNDYELLKEMLSHVYITEIVSGGDLGADHLAEVYAKEKNIPLSIVPHTENIGVHDRRRAYAIIDQVKLVIAFWDGKSQGTCDLIKYTQKKGKPIKIINFRVTD
jgi:hypothetical protein